MPSGPARCLGTLVPAVLAAAPPAVQVGVQPWPSPDGPGRRSPCRRSRGSGEPSAASARAIVIGESLAGGTGPRALRAPGQPGTSSAFPGVGTCLPDARRQSPGGAHVRRCARRRQLLEAARPSRRAAASNDSPRPIPARISSRSSALNGLPGMMGPLPVVGSGSLGRDGRTLATTGGTRLRSRKSERLERVP